MSLSGVIPGTHVFFHHISTNDQVPAIVLGLAPQPGDCSSIQHAADGKAIVHETTATTQKPEAVTRK